jgi:eukaryotic-like serine/threonine-protein kinase
MSSNPPWIDPPTWREIAAHLDRAFDLSPPERERWLADLDRTTPAVAARVRELLARHDGLADSDFLERSAWTEIESAQRAAMIGRRIGAYTIERVIGHGGMGEVWLASRSDGRFEARCALKFLDSHNTLPSVADRFRREGRLLARLAHPNIARLLDAGTAEDGHQYLVLEYVDGEPIDKYCDSHSLAVEARVRLFLDVIAAVAHAHTNLVIHRDLKPSNVLVTRDGHVKLLDFGIAKLVSADSTHDDASATRFGDLALTPEYAAPEQLIGDMPSTATDVYQLGMLLYVLLTGRHPLQRCMNRGERIRAALEGRLPRASDFALASARKALRGDLDSILAMALRQDPRERYMTAAALGDDLRRYLTGEAVVARRGAAWYYARKFVGRHRIAVLTSAAAIVGLCAALVFAYAQAGIAGAERDHAITLASRNAAVTDFMGTVITEAAESDKPVSVKDIVARSEQLALADTSRNRENRAAVLGMLASYYHMLTDYARSASLLDRALALLDSPQQSDLRAELTCTRALVTANLGDVQAALVAITRELEHPPADAWSLASCLESRATLAQIVDDAPGALRYATEALARMRESGRVSKEVEAKYLETAATAYYINNRPRESMEYYDLALKDLAELGRSRGAASIVLRANWAVANEGVGMPSRALQLHEENLSIAKERDPTASPHPFLTLNRARALEYVGRYADARSGYELALQLCQSAKVKRGQVYALIGLAGTSIRLRDGAAAETYLSQLGQLLNPSEPADRLGLAKMAALRGGLHLAAGRADQARQDFERALVGHDNRPTMIEAHLGRAEAELLAGDARVAEREARIALDLARAQQGGVQWSSRTGLSWFVLGKALQQLGDVHAQGAYVAAVNNLANTVDAQHPALVQARALVSRPRITPVSEYR